MTKKVTTLWREMQRDFSQQRWRKPKVPTPVNAQYLAEADDKRRRRASKRLRDAKAQGLIEEAS